MKVYNLSSKNNNRKVLVIGIIYYVLIILATLFFNKQNKISGELIQVIYTFLLLFLLPILIIKKGFREKIKEYNLPNEKIRKQVFLAMSIIWLGSLLIWLFMLQWGGNDMTKTVWWNWGIVRLAGENLLIFPLIIFFQEFFFRGFLLKTLNKNLNNLMSVIILAVLVVIFNMLLLQKIFNWQIILGIVLLNILLNLIVLRFKSVVYSFFIYWLSWIILNFWILWQVAQTI